AAQNSAMLSRNLLPDRLALMLAERDPPIGLRMGQKDSPAIFRHLHVSEIRPSFRVNRNRGAQIDLGSLKPLGAHLVPPFKKLRLPGLQRPLKPAVVRQVDVI